MAYLMKFKGKYRLKTAIDKITNDFPRDENGMLEQNDIYIDCMGGSQITHYGRSTLMAYIPSLGRGHNILIAIAKELNVPEDRNYEVLYSNLEKEGTIKDIHDTDGEVEFKFDAKNIDFIAKYLKPKTSGAGISPFSTKNLPKAKYEISEDNLREYKVITDTVPKDKLLTLSQITNDFLFKYLQKKKQYRAINIKQDMRKKMLKSKEYIHCIGEWGNYLEYLKKELEKRL